MWIAILVLKEETTEEDFLKLPEVQGSSDTKDLTGGSLMEPLSDQQKDFFHSYLDDARNRMEEERREERKFYEETISRMKEQMEEMREDYNDLRRSRSSPVIENPNPKHAFETPKVQRPQDKAYQEILTASKNERQREPENYTLPRNDANQNTQNEMMQLYDVRMTNLMASMGSILKHSKKEDTTELPKFQGSDSQWPKWYQLLRAYLQAGLRIASSPARGEVEARSFASVADGFLGATVFFCMFVLLVVVRGLSVQEDFVGHLF
jgi:hypothetical protein